MRSPLKDTARLAARVFGPAIPGEQEGRKAAEETRAEVMANLDALDPEHGVSRPESASIARSIASAASTAEMLRATESALIDARVTFALGILETQGRLAETPGTEPLRELLGRILMRGGPEPFQQAPSTEDSRP